MIVEDQLPGGLEALNERLNTTSHVAIAGGTEEPYYYWQDYGYNNKEIRGDRVSFFITEMEAGRHTFRYMARATHSGRLCRPAGRRSRPCTTRPSGGGREATGSSSPPARPAGRLACAAGCGEHKGPGA